MRLLVFFIALSGFVLSCKEVSSTPCDCVDEVIGFMIKDRESGYQLKEGEHEWSEYCKSYTDSMNNLSQSDQEKTLEEWTACPNYDAYDQEFELLIEHLKKELETDLGPLDDFEQEMEDLMKE